MWFNLFKSDYKIRSQTLTKNFDIPTDFVNTFGFQRTDPLGVLIKEKEKEVWILHNPDSEYYEDLITEVNRL
jgi:hypothetical protein